MFESSFEVKCIYPLLFNMPGGVHLPPSISGRTMISTWWLFCIVVVAIYSGNLVAFLTVTKERAPFQTLQGLVDLKGTYKWGTIGQSVWELTVMVGSLRRSGHI